MPHCTHCAIVIVKDDAGSWRTEKDYGVDPRLCPRSPDEKHRPIEEVD